MKIAICGFGFSGATLPLAKAFISTHKVNSVDCYYLVYKSNRLTEIESIDFGEEQLKIGIPHRLSKGNKLYNYLPNNVLVYLVPLCPNGPETFHWISRTINHLIIFYLAILILCRKYHFVNIVAHSPLEFLLNRIVSKFKKTIVSVHEVFVSLNNKKIIKSELELLSKVPVDVVFHSKNVYTDFVNNIKTIRCKMHIIPFSNFESYTSFDGNQDVIDTSNYMLFIGSIQPYKGLGLLKEALNDDVMDFIKVVIAGKGSVPELDYFQKRKNTYLLNRYISNEELVNLIKKSAFFVCPYIVASQTGIAPTAFVFNKPIVATNVGAFHEAIVDGYNGFLVNPNDSKQLRQRILELYENSSLRGMFAKNIETSNLDAWNKIANEYLKILR